MRPPSAQGNGTAASPPVTALAQGAVAPAPTDQEEAVLTIGRTLGVGAEGKVFELPSLVGAHAYKQYLRPGADPVALQRLVDFPATLDFADREFLVRQTAWPLARVMAGGRLRGFIMQQIPERFCGRNAAGTPTNRSLMYLLHPPKPLWGDITPPAVRARLEIAREMVSLLAFLNSNSMIVGDISMSNFLWSVDPRPAVFLIDCDGVRRLGRRPVHDQQRNTPGWLDPMLSGPQAARPLDLDSDRYKCALLAGRVLSASAYAEPPQELDLIPGIPGDVAQGVADLWRQAGRARGSRPDATQWKRVLDRAR